jgi:hypothetical protein
LEALNEPAAQGWHSPEPAVEYPAKHVQFDKAPLPACEKLFNGQAWQEDSDVED